MKATRSVVVMARRPLAGAVKTRLAADVGPGCALAVYRLMLKRTLRRVSAGPWRTVVAATPAGGRHRSWARGLPVIAQPRGGLGERMQAAFDAMPHGPVVMVGTDIPGLRRHHVRRAFRALGSHDAVFGPALDGGYWLVGLGPPLRGQGIFRDVRWSTRHALGDTLGAIPGAFSHALIDTLHDIDTAADLDRWLSTGDTCL